MPPRKIIWLVSSITRLYELKVQFHGMLETIEIQPASEAKASVIWLHGLGADGHDFEPIVPELRLPDTLGVRFIFPHAPVRPVTLNGGMPMRAWFDIYSLERDMRVDLEGIAQARSEVLSLVAREQARGIPASRIVIAGFSQGGSLALVTALGWKTPLAGIIGLSCWLPAAYMKVHEAQVRTPVFLAHGTFDPVVAVDYGRATHSALSEAGMTVDWHEYPMAHQVCAEQIADISSFLATALATS